MTHLSELLRRHVIADRSVSHVARATGVPQATLQEFVSGRSDGTYPDLRVSSAEKLIEFFGIDELLRAASIPKPGKKRMKLIDELQACECTDSREKFRERLVDALQEQFTGTTIDDLVCAPDDAIRYCDFLRSETGCPNLLDAVILKTLMNIRKSKECPRDLKKRRTPQRLQTALKDAACDLRPDQFRDLANDCLADMYKNRTIDELVCHPRESRALCNYVRAKAGCSILTSELILRTIMNSRKNPGQAS
jgi:hypothetical protein